MPSTASTNVPSTGKAVAIAAALRARISSGELRPGDSLPSESALTDTYGVSQPTMRSALRILESEGLVRIQRGSKGGARVQELDIAVLARQAGFYLQLQGADLADLLEALVLMQPGAVALAAQRRTPAHLRELRRCVVRAESCASMREFSDVAADFVVLLLEISGNRSITLFALVTNSLIHQELHRLMDDLESTDVIAHHAAQFRRLVELIEERESEAASALWRAHMLTSITPALRPQPRTGPAPRSRTGPRRLRESPGSSVRSA